MLYIIFGVYIMLFVGYCFVSSLLISDGNIFQTISVIIMFIVVRNNGCRMLPDIIRCDSIYQHTHTQQNT